MPKDHLSSEFLEYLATSNNNGEDKDRIPSLSELSKELEVSVPRLREQLEVARAMGFVDVRPRTGIRRLPYTFFPAVRESLFYAIALDRKYFEAFSELRRYIEAAYWREAVGRLTPQDHEDLRALLNRAWKKLNGTPIQIPQGEHRELHLLIYRRLENPFVLGLLEAYWDAYEAVGLDVYEDYRYLRKVWAYHERMVDAICAGDFEDGYVALVEHTELIYHRPVPHPIKENVTTGS